MYWICPSCWETCEHPQPFMDVDGRRWCGACWFMAKTLVAMVESDVLFPNPSTPKLPAAERGPS